MIRKQIRLQASCPHHCRLADDLTYKPTVQWRFFKVCGQHSGQCRQLATDLSTDLIWGWQSLKAYVMRSSPLRTPQGTTPPTLTNSSQARRTSALQLLLHPSSPQDQVPNILSSSAFWSCSPAGRYAVCNPTTSIHFWWVFSCFVLLMSLSLLSL